MLNTIQNILNYSNGKADGSILDKILIRDYLKYIFEGSEVSIQTIDSIYRGDKDADILKNLFIDLCSFNSRGVYSEILVYIVK